MYRADHFLVATTVAADVAVVAEAAVAVAVETKEIAVAKETADAEEIFATKK